MALTPTGAALTEAHRLAQVALSKSTVSEFVTAWSLLSVKTGSQLFDAFPGYARMAKLIIDANRSKSSRLAAAYLQAFRTAEGATIPLTAAMANEIAEREAIGTLAVTGPAVINRDLRNGKPLEAAMSNAFVQSAGAVTRFVQNAGRETIEQSVLRDEAAYGVARVTDGNPCSFCAMLCSRGAVYKSEMTADFEAHAHCNCTSEPVYGTDGYQTPGRSQEFSDLWAESTRDAANNHEAEIHFRRAIEGRASDAPLRTNYSNRSRRQSR